MRQAFTRIHRINESEINRLKKRIDIATIVIISFVALLIARLWYLQIHRGLEYSQLSENNRIRAHATVAPRGNIMDRDGKMMTSNRPCFNILWIREDAPNPDKVIKQLAKILDEDVASILDRIRAGSDRPRHMPIRLKRDIDWKTLVYIENHHFKMPGARIEVLPARDYISGDLASHLIGYLGEATQQDLRNSRDKYYKNGDQLGKMGVEKQYDKYLRGERGTNYVEVDVHGFEQRQLQIQEPLPGSDVHLTIDLDLQQIAEQQMSDKAGAVVAMEVDTGRLLVLSSSPGLPLEQFIGGISTPDWQAMLDNHLKPLINKTIQGQYPPGSTYKIITALAGLAEEAVTPDTVFHCSGSLAFRNRNYRCWKRGGHGDVSLHRALTESCDVYFYQVGQAVGVDTLAQYAKSFGLGVKTNIALDHEKPGLVPTTAWKKKRYNQLWHDGETLSLAIGQGFNLVTPLQLCRMMAATVNGGILYRPQYVEMVKDPDGEPVHHFEPIIEGRSLGNEKSLKIVREALVAVVNGARGTGRAARLKNVTVGGKTGTAQVIRLSQEENIDEEKIPYEHRDHAWFTCYAPAEKPKIAIAVLVEHGGHGGSTAGPIAKAILEKYFDKQSKTIQITSAQAITPTQ